MDSIDILVIGGGAVGLACAARLANPQQSLLIVEAESLIGSHTSSRNSEVIHAGIYYAPGSLKAQLCLEGRERLYSWCAQHQVAHRKIGKLLVAVTANEISRLDALASNAIASGVEPLQEISRAQLQQLEPAVCAVAALYSPHTGIIDSHEFIHSLLGAAERQGAQLVLNTRVSQLQRAPDGWIASGKSAGEPFQIKTQQVINAGGLFAQQLAQQTSELPGATIPKLHLCQGRYFSYSGRSPFNHLIYPMPEANNAGLGVHATLDMGGQLRFGPDTEYIERIDYNVDAQLRDAFAAAISRYFPALDSARLSPAYSGIRPKLSGAGEPPADFIIQTSAIHGLEGLINLYGIESPGLTASLAIADRVALYAK